MEEDAELVWELVGEPIKSKSCPFTSYRMMIVYFGEVEEPNIQKISKK